MIAIFLEDRPVSEGGTQQDVRSRRLAISFGIDLRRGEIGRFEAVDLIEEKAGNPLNPGGTRPAVPSTTLGDEPWWLAPLPRP